MYNALSISWNSHLNDIHLNIHQLVCITPMNVYNHWINTHVKLILILVINHLNLDYIAPHFPIRSPVCW